MAGEECEEVRGLVAKVENKSERPPEQGAKCQSPPRMGFTDTLTYMYHTALKSSGIKKYTGREAREKRL